MRLQQALSRIRELSRPLEPLPTGIEPRLQSLPVVRAVLFDVYGTLLISASGELGTALAGSETPGAESPPGALAAAFGALEIPVPAAALRRLEQLLASIIRGLHERARAAGIDFPEVDIVSVFQELLRRLRSVDGPPLPADRGTAERLALEHELRCNPTWPMPGMGATLAALKRKDLRLGIVSNAQFYTPWLFPAYLGTRLPGLGFTPRLCAWSYRCGSAKPSASLFLGPLRALERRRIPASATLVVGNDRRNDVIPASRLGCRTALFAGDARSYRPRDQATGQEDRPNGPEPDLLLTALPQLLEILP